MRRIISVTLIVLILSVSFTLLVSAASTDSENVMTHITDDLNSVFGFTMYGCSVEKASWLPVNAFNGNREYDSSSNSSFVSFGIHTEREIIEIGSEPRYNMDGEEFREDSKYLAVLIFKLDSVYTVGSYAVYFQKAMNTSLDGFDILVSETGESGSWSVVSSTENMTCGQTGGKWQQSPDGTYFASGEFSPAKAGYIALGITQPRCIHLDAMIAAGTGTTVNAPHYFRLTEFEVFTTDAEVTTAPPETTPAPIETTAPPSETTPSPDDTTPSPDDTTPPPADDSVTPDTPSAPSDKNPNIVISVILLAVAALLGAGAYIVSSTGKK